MSIYRVELRPRAVRDVAALSKEAQRRIVSALGRLERNPRARVARKLTHSEDLYRMRVGDYRVVYEITDAELLVLVVRVGHRRHVYR